MGVKHGRKARRKETLERPRFRWKVNINIHIGEIVCGVMEWINLARDRNQWRDAVSMELYLQVP
jgi:hypothetical protein